MKRLQAAIKEAKKLIEAGGDDQVKDIGENTKVYRYNIIGTKFWIYQANEKLSSAKHTEGVESGIPYNEIMTFGNNWYGRIGSGITPKDYGKAMTDERYKAVMAAQEEQYQRAYKLILEAFPEAKSGKKTMGQIETTEGAY